jgi:hypothetical protein
MSLRVKRSNLVQNSSDKTIATPVGLVMTMVKSFLCLQYLGKVPNFSQFISGELDAFDEGGDV